MAGTATAMTKEEAAVMVMATAREEVAGEEGEEVEVFFF